MSIIIITVIIIINISTIIVVNIAYFHYHGYYFCIYCGYYFDFFVMSAHSLVLAFMAKLTIKRNNLLNTDFLTVAIRVKNNKQNFHESNSSIFY